jgi:hypothetical protein
MALIRNGVSFILLALTLVLVQVHGNRPASAQEPKDADREFRMWECDAKRLAERIRSLRARSDAELVAAVASKRTLNKETIAEMLRRGGPKLFGELQRRYESCRDERVQAKFKEPNVGRSENCELLLLSAVNKAKKLPDPLPVVIKGDAKREVTFPEMPVFEVAIVNRHPEKREVAWQEGGNYRHGRRESFSFEVRRDDGEVMPVVPPKYGIGGGIISFIELKNGEEWTNKLPLASYIKRLPAGKYNVRAAYAFGHDIGMLPDKSATFMCLSRSVDLVVSRRTVRLSSAERVQADRWCHALPTDQPVKILEGSKDKGSKARVGLTIGKQSFEVTTGIYDKEIHGKFIAPESPPGQILQLEWKAVPSLIGVLEDKKLKPVQRAWVVALLYSITGENNPFGEGEDDLYGQMLADMDGGPLGPCEVFTAGWSVLDAKGQGGYSPDQKRSVSGKINAEQQAKLTQQWIAWKKNIDVVETRTEPPTRDERQSRPTADQPGG